MNAIQCFFYLFVPKLLESAPYKTHGCHLEFLRKDIAQYQWRHKSRAKLLMFQKCPINVQYGPRERVHAGWRVLGRGSESPRARD